jgi:hypothetical protein
LFIAQKPPQQNRAGRNFDNRIKAKTDKRDASGNRARANSNNGFQRIPTDS